MNTELLKQHLNCSLNGLANACQTNQKTENTDRIVLYVLCDEQNDEVRLIENIGRVNDEYNAITDTQEFLSGSTLYSSAQQGERPQQNKLLIGLREIAATINHQGKHKSVSMMDFIYRALRGLNDESHCENAIQEMAIVAKIHQN